MRRGDKAKRRLATRRADYEKMMEHLSPEKQAAYKKPGSLKK